MKSPQNYRTNMRDFGFLALRQPEPCGLVYAPQQFIFWLHLIPAGQPASVCSALRRLTEELIHSLHTIYTYPFQNGCYTEMSMTAPNQK
jgi:hypothetical protein